MSDVATLPTAATHPDECLRCGYNLIGIANDRACPECGLLAERSRRVTDELHQSRPRWLRRLSCGVWLILLAILAPVVLVMAVNSLQPWLSFLTVRAMNRHSSSAGLWDLLYRYLPLLPFEPPAILLMWGVWLLGLPEGYAPADRADAWRRRFLRLAVLGPLATVALVHADRFLNGRLSRFLGYPLAELAVIGLATLGSVPLVLLLARRLRDLARRARSAHLAEHCVIVGIGAAATLVYVLVAGVILDYGDRWGLGTNWTTRGTAPLLIMLAMMTAGALFVLWQLYLLVRFAIAFGRASRQLRRQWRRDDRAGEADGVNA